MCLQTDELDNIYDMFSGYVDPFWYEKEETIYTKFYWICREILARQRFEQEKVRPNIKSAGTKPDIEIRWKK
jgi:hypothetical protein